MADNKARKAVWDDRFYIRVYLLARGGLSDNKIAETLGVTFTTWGRWLKSKEALVYTLAEARKDKESRGRRSGGSPSFRSYVYDRLSPELKNTWDQICACQNARNGVQRLEAIIADRGERVRQELYVYALIHCSFNHSEACRMLNLSYTELKRWKQDPDFADLLEEMEWHKGNFFEEPLFDLVRARDPNIVWKVNSTFNRERGYGEKLELTGGTTHTHTHLHAEMDMEQLLPLLSVSAKREILDAMRQLREGQEAEQLPALPAPVEAADVVEAEIIP